ncbi:MAG: enoyl-CoA hydratase-related protein [Alphaproteobacteria bacterium]|nr:enoyl-CoA hydratase-related protein [Alphaproteobacteria bacterium]
MSDDPIYLQRDGDIARLILNRPQKRNALTLAMWEAVPDLVAEAEAEAGVRILLVQGSDATAFAAGADIGEFESVFATEAGRGRYSDAVYAAEQALGRCGKPVIAMIQGDCIGGGVELALACDLRFASTDSRFGITPSRLGLVYSLTSTKRLIELVGPSRAKDLLYSGRLFDAREALSLGIVDRVVAGEALQAETRAYAEEICSRSPNSVQAAKAIVQMILDGATDETPASRSLRVDGFAGPDAKEGIRAYLDRRPPKFSSS